MKTKLIKISLILVIGFVSYFFILFLILLPEFLLCKTVPFGVYVCNPGWIQNYGAFMLSHNPSYVIIPILVIVTGFLILNVVKGEK